jgi:hypothetical protein
LRFHGYGIAWVPLESGDDGGTDDPFRSVRLAFRIRPDQEPDDRVARIFSICDERFREHFFAGQWKSHLILRYVSGGSRSTPPLRETGLDGVFRKGRPAEILVRSDASGLSVSVDGRTVEVPGENPLRRFTGRFGRAILFLGNSPDGRNPWEGELGIADPEPLVPAVFRPPGRIVLFPPWKEERFGRPFWTDAAINLAGFIPFGFFLRRLAWKPRGRFRGLSAVFVVLAGAAVSLAIELLQAHLPSRDSSLTDTLWNTCGTWVGFMLSGIGSPSTDQAS